MSWVGAEICGEIGLRTREGREARLADLQGDMDTVLERLHLEEVADTRQRLESDANRVWGPGWRDR